MFDKVSISWIFFTGTTIGMYINIRLLHIRLNKWLFVKTQRDQTFKSSDCYHLSIMTVGILCLRHYRMSAFWLCYLTLFKLYALTLLDVAGFELHQVKRFPLFCLVLYIWYRNFRPRRTEKNDPHWDPDESLIQNRFYYSFSKSCWINSSD